MCICVRKIACFDFNRSVLVGSCQCDKSRSGRHHFVHEKGLCVGRGIRILRYWQNDRRIVHLVYLIRYGCGTDQDQIIDGDHGDFE